jgi:hypothetical protein
MIKIFNKKIKPQTQNFKAQRVNRHVLIFCIVGVIMVTIACNSNPLFGISTTPDYDPEIVIIVNGTESTTERLEPTKPEHSGSMPEPVTQPEKSQGSDTETNLDGIKEYSVTATNDTCICQVDGNVNVELRVNGDQLEVIDSAGGVQVYDKIGENTYKRSWMGYYINVTDGVETKVDEEKSVVIILNNNGYIMEHYSGTESLPCCTHTFTKTN